MNQNQNTPKADLSQYPDNQNRRYELFPLTQLLTEQGPPPQQRQLTQEGQVNNVPHNQRVYKQNVSCISNIDHWNIYIE